MMPVSEETNVRNTGGQVDDLVMALIDAAYDKEGAVQERMCSAIVELGKKQPALVLSSCLKYLQKHSKLPQGHRIVVLNSMENVIKETQGEIDKSLAYEVIQQASYELTGSKEVVPDWQTAASGVLVAIGCKYCHEVMEELMNKFQPGVLPHFFVVQTMANLATANVFGMVPFINVILGTCLTVLGMAKQDNIRWVLSYALNKFCEAILDYVANIEKAPDKSIKTSVYSNDIDAAYEVLFNVWLNTREAKLRLAIVEALGQMAHIMSEEKLIEQLPRLLPGMLSLYKKSPEPYHVTQGLCMVLDACTVNQSTILDTHLENLFNVIFPQICQPVDYGQPLKIKNHNELLRCFAVISRSFSDRLVGYLLQKLEQPIERQRIGVLGILRHLVNSCATYMTDKQSLLLSGLKMVLQDPSNKVKKELAQTIIAMAHHDYLHLEGGQLMVEFIVRQTALPPDTPGKRSPDPDAVSNEALRAMCDNVLQLLSTTVENMDTVLWPNLLEYILPVEYTDGMAALTKALSHIATRKRAAGDDDFDIDFEKQVNIPKPPALTARFLVMIGCLVAPRYRTLGGWPRLGKNRGMYVLLCMQALGPVIYDGISQLWDTVIPKLTQYLEDAMDIGDEEWNQKNWEDLVLKWLSKTLDHIDDEEWILQLGSDMCNQISLYGSYSEEKNFLYKCIGVVMRKTTKKEFVNKGLDAIFTSVKHTIQLEREGCAIATGFASASHLDSVLSKMDAIGKNDTGKKSSGFLGFIKDIGKGDIDEHTKSTLMLCYGYVTIYAPPELITSRMESTIMRTMLPHFSSVKELVVKQSLIRATELIGEGMHPNHLKLNHNFSNRGNLIVHMQNYMRSESTSVLSTETRALAMNACANLVILDPKLSEAETLELMKTALNCTIPLPLGGSVSPKAKSESYESEVKQEKLMEDTLNALENLLEQMLVKDVSSHGLESIYKHLYPWTCSEKDHERERSVIISLQLFLVYLDKLQVMAGKNNQFENFGSILARLVPRCSDPVFSIRQAAIDSITCLLKIKQKYELNKEEDPVITALPQLKDRVKKTDSTTMFSVINDLAKALSRKIPSEQLEEFVERILDGLVDPHANSSSGACVVLNGVIKTRGAELSPQKSKGVERILSCLHGKLSVIKSDQTRTGALRCIRTLASHHMLTVISALLNYPLPYDQNTVDCWRIFGQDPQLTGVIIDSILDTLSKSLPYEEKADSRDKDVTVKTALIIPIAATCALSELFQVEECRSQIVDNYHRLLSTIMVRIASTVGVKPPKVMKDSGKVGKDKKPVMIQVDLSLDPCEVSIQACKHLLTHSGSTGYIEILDEAGAWGKLSGEDTYPEGFTDMARYMVETQPEYINRIIKCLNPVMNSVYDPQRVMVTAFFAEMINQRCGGDMAIVEMLVNSLLGKLVDSCHRVRMMCVRGLGNVSSNGPEQVQKYSTTVLSAMMAGMDDKDDLVDDITLEAMSGLTKILAEIDETHIRAILINIALKIRPCFEKDRGSVRAAAFILFGNLSRFADGPSRDPFLEQIHTNLVSLLLHLNDPEVQVREASKSCLKQVSQLLGSARFDEMVQKRLVEGGSLHYGEFVNDLSKVMIEDFPDKLNFYVMGCVTFFRSFWPEIKANAAILAGFLLGNMNKDQYFAVSKEHVSGALILLLKDASPEVRTKAAEAISGLHSF